MAQMELQCPSCEKRLRMSDEHLGKTVRCPSCKQTFSASPPQPKPANPPKAKPAAARVVANPEPDPPSQSRVRVIRRETSEDSGSSPSAREQAAAKPAREKPAKKSSNTGGRKGNSKPRRKQTQEADPWQESEDLWSTTDDYGDSYSSEDYDDPYAAAPQPKTRRKAKSDVPQKLLKTGLFVLLILLAVGTVGGLGYFAWKNIPGLGGNVVNMAYLPENLDGFIYAEPASIVNSAIGKAIQAKFSSFQQTTANGVIPGNFADVDSIVIGYWPSSGPLVELPPMLTSPWGNSTGGRDFLAVIRANKRIDMSKAPASGQVTHNGMTLYRLDSNDQGKVACLADSKTMLLGSEQSVKAALDRNGKEFKHTKFGFVRGSGQVIIAGAGTSSVAPPASPDQTASLATPPEMPVSPFDASRKVSESISQNTVGGSLALSFGSRLDLSAVVMCNDDSTASRISSELKTAIENAKTQIANLPPIPTLSNLSGPLTGVLNSLVISQSGKTVSATGVIEQSLIDNIPSSRF